MRVDIVAIERFALSQLVKHWSDTAIKWTTYLAAREDVVRRASLVTLHVLHVD